jgi:hypothetical protein
LKTIQEEEEAKPLANTEEKGGRFYEDCSVGEKQDDDSNRQSESCKK